MKFLTLQAMKGTSNREAGNPESPETPESHLCRQTRRPRKPRGQELREPESMGLDETKDLEKRSEAQNAEGYSRGKPACSFSPRQPKQNDPRKHTGRALQERRAGPAKVGCVAKN